MVCGWRRTWDDGDLRPGTPPDGSDGKYAVLDEAAFPSPGAVESAVPALGRSGRDRESCHCALPALRLPQFWSGGAMHGEQAGTRDQLLNGQPDGRRVRFRLGNCRIAGQGRPDARAGVDDHRVEGGAAPVGHGATYLDQVGADVGGADALLLQGFPQGAGHFRWQMGVGPRRGRTPSLDFRAVRGFPTALGETQQAALKGAVQGLPELSGIEPANWNRKVARQFVSERFGIGLGIGLSRGSCLNYPRLHGGRLCTVWDLS